MTDLQPNGAGEEKLEILEKAPEVAAGVGAGAIAIAVAFLLVFSWIAERVEVQATMRFDLAVRGWVHRFASPGLTTFMEAMSFIGGQVLAVLAIVTPAGLWLRKKRRAAAWMTLTMAGALVLDLALKYAFHRARPVPFFGGVPPTYSFPSGHSMFSFCFFGTLAGLLSARSDSRLATVCYYMAAAILTGLIGLSRIYLGVHYPTDVLAGFVAAAFWVSTVVLLDRFRRRGRA